MQSKTIEQITLFLCLCLPIFLTGQITIDYPTELSLECTDDLSPGRDNPKIGFPNITTTCQTGIPTVTFSDNIDQLTECGGTGVLMRFWSVSDNCGGFKTLLQSITLEDTTPPEINCVSDVVVDCDASLNPAENPDLGFPEIIDCSDPDQLTVRYSDRNEGQGVCGNLPEIVRRTWTVVDACGNESTCEQAIRVGIEALAVLCDTEDFSQECNGFDGSAFAAVSWDLNHVNQLRNCASSECGGIEVISDFDFGRLEGGCSITGSLEVNYLIKDACGNTKFKVATFTLRDTTPPESFCSPIDFEVNCEGDEAAASRVAAWHADNLTLIESCLFDNCGTVTVSSNFNPSNFNINNLNFDCNDTIGFPVEYILTDECGNTGIKMASLRIVDNGPPTFENIPRDTSIGANDNIPVATPIVFDNCSDNLMTEFEEERIDNTVDDGYQLIRMWIATDDCGNVGMATQRINVLDPILSLACTSAKVEVSGDKIIISDLLAPNEIVKVFASDNRVVYNCFRNCGEVQTTRALAEGTYMVDVQFYTATWQSICSDVRTITIGNGGDTGGGNTGGGDGGGDTGGGNTDPCTATECETIPPVLSNIPADMTVDANAVPSPTNPTATDNCDNSVSIILSEARTEEVDANNYVLTRTWTATDDCGNTVSAQQVIRIEGDTDGGNTGGGDGGNTGGGSNDPCDNSDCETIAPILANIPANITVDANSVPAPGQPIATDNCDTNVEIIPTETITESVDANNYVLNRTWTATDDCGNTASATQVIRVVTGDGGNTGGGDGGSGTDGGNTGGGDSGTDGGGNTGGDGGANPALCGEVVIIAANQNFNFSNIKAANSIIKIFDLEYNILLECNADCGSEVNFAYEIAGTYLADIQLYTTDWEFICETRQTVVLSDEVDGGNTGGGDGGNTGGSDCDATVITVGSSTIEISNLTAPNKIVKLFDADYNVLEECNGVCSGPITFSTVPTGRFYVDVQLYTEEWGLICTTQKAYGEGENNGGNTGGGDNSQNECMNVEVIATQTAIVFNNVNRANKIIKVFDADYQEIFNCFTDCEEQIIVDIFALGLYHIDIQLYNDEWEPICEDRREMMVTGDSPSDVCAVIECSGGNSGGDSGNTGGNNNSGQTANCNDIQIRTTTSSIELINLNAENIIVKVFNANFDIIFQCFSTCGENTNISRLAAGNYQVNINYYDENWGGICERIEPIIVGSSVAPTNMPSGTVIPNSTNKITILDASNPDFTVYPNPASQEVMIDINAFKGQEVQLKIYNQLSAEVWQQSLGKTAHSTQRINVADLENGVYLLSLQTEGQAPLVKKLLIAK